MGKTQQTGLRPETHPSGGSLADFALRATYSSCAAFPETDWPSARRTSWRRSHSEEACYKPKGFYFSSQKKFPILILIRM
jgi:hypothetical protein